MNILRIIRVLVIPFCIVFLAIGFINPDILDDFLEGNLLFFIGIVIFGYLGYLSIRIRDSEEKKITREQVLRTFFELGFFIIAAVIVHQILGL
ncbi:hypothetical protein [Salicibibacter kimchii]|uniref:Uncharacterized protein n=1 Tax=Salicibibacter kimchii TaxID=2099786 RepID=A0A345BUW9_9BACI|nr:hypothetical protein [Salicibibacter kimchii]AXF54750.1 hypothetical protein DT065_01080 [Salicibibacter kimchii]